MICEECKQNPATIHLQQTINNVKITKKLCNQCIKKYEESVFSLGNNFSVQDLFKGMFKPVMHTVGGHSVHACHDCGLSYQDFNRTGKLGCGSCYTAFKNQLEPLLRRMHGTSKHIGKAVPGSGARMEMNKRLKGLRDVLATHIANEEYEQAARVRDEIRSLEAEKETRLRRGDES